MAYSEYGHGQLVQSPNYDCTDIFFVTKGGLAICETTCFEEPFLIYGPGAVVNLYQVMMSQRLNFSLKAVSADYYQERIVDDGSGYNTITFTENEKRDIFDDYRYSGSVVNGLEFMSIEADVFNDICDLFPRSAAVFQKFSVEQVKHLSEVRQQKLHLHSGNSKRAILRKNPKFLEERADFDGDLAIEI